MATISFFKTGANSEEQQIGFSSDPTLPLTNNQIGFDFPITFSGGNFSASSILVAARSMIGGQRTATPLQGGTLTINGQSVGNYDYKVAGTTTISSFSSSEWFTTTADTVSSWIIINGNLTINSGQTIIPSVRKLFTVVYVTGNLVVNGSISMTARGANHSGTGNSGGYVAPVDIRVGTGTFSAVTNPIIPSAGGAGGASFTSGNGKNDGTAGTNGASGGGGSGYSFSGGNGGAGTAGTCFTGGTGGGGGNGSNGTDGIANGGKGGNAAPGPTDGGSGNPGGNAGSSGFAGNSGTGGTLIVICGGSFSGTGSCISNGVDAFRPNSGYIPGGASGGGSVTVLYGTNPSGGTVTASGGSGNSGGNGGAGTARKLAIGAN